MRNQMGNQANEMSTFTRHDAPPVHENAATARMVICVLFPLLGTLLVFEPILHSYFFGDDFLHLIEVVNSGIGAELWRPYMSHLYVVPKLVYWALWHVAGMRSEIYFAFVLIVHLFNVAAFFLVARTLIGSTRLASLGALGWGSCALHAGTLSWFCVHGHALGTMALLLALYGLARAVAARRPVGLGISALSGLALFAGSMCFGTMFAIATVFPLAAIACAGQLLRRRERAVLIVTALAVVAVYVGVHWIYPVTIGARPLISLSFTFGNLALMLETMVDLFGVGLGSLVGSFAWVPQMSVPFRSTPGVILAIGAALVTLAGAALSAPTRGRWFVGLTVLAVAAYGSVAVGRAALMPELHDLLPSSVAVGRAALMPELHDLPTSSVAQVFRYHYAASVPLALMLTLATATLLARLRMCPAAKDALYAGVSAAWLIGFSLSGWRMDLLPDTRPGVQRVLAVATQRASSVAVGGTVSIPDRRFNPVGVWGHGCTWAGVFTLFHDSDEVDGRHIRYIPDPKWSPARPPVGSLLAQLLSQPNGSDARQ